MSAPADHAELQVAEGIAGLFLYHLRKPGEHRSLCDVQVMLTHIPLSAWGVRTHINERWCSKCRGIADGGQS